MKLHHFLDVGQLDSCSSDVLSGTNLHIFGNVAGRRCVDLLSAGPHSCLFQGVDGWRQLRYTTYSKGIMLWKKVLSFFLVWNFPHNQIFLLDLLVVGSACGLNLSIPKYSSKTACIQSLPKKSCGCFCQTWQVLQFWSHYRQSHTLRASAQADFTMKIENRVIYRYECRPRGVCTGSTVPGW